MAAHTELKAKTATLGAGTADSVTITGQATFLELVHHSNVTDPIYFTVGTSVVAPVAAADDTEVILPGERLRLAVSRGAENRIVNLISAGGATYTVIGVL